MVYDLHTLQNRFYFDGGTLATLHTAFPLIVDKVCHSVSPQQRTVTTENVTLPAMVMRSAGPMVAYKLHAIHPIYSLRRVG